MPQRTEHHVPVTLDYCSVLSACLSFGGRAAFYPVTSFATYRPCPLSPMRPLAAVVDR